MLIVDTNVLVYAADADSPFHAACRGWLDRRRGRADAWYTSWSILYEFLRVTTHPRVMRRPWNVIEAWSFVQAILASPGLDILVPTQQHPMVAEQVIRELPPRRQLTSRRTYSDPYARARNPADLHPRCRLSSFSFSRSH